MSTKAIFRDQPYQTQFEARVIAAEDDFIVLDRTLFYPQGGGQPGDRGTLVTAAGATLEVTDTRKGEHDVIEHRTAADSTLPAAGSSVIGEIDWAVRHARMRMHTCLHLLSAVIPAPVTGGSLSETRGRLDFDLAESTLEREAVTAELNHLIEQDLPVTSEWITEDELAARPDLVKTMSVRPPSGTGTVRIVRIGDVDLQACGGTHVARTAEIGGVDVTKIEKKSRHNRRVSLAFAAGT